MNDLLVELFRHNTWANVRMIEFCRDLPTDQRDAQSRLVGTFGQIQETLEHLVSAQEHYLAVYGRRSNEPDAYKDWNDLVARARQSSQEYEQWTSEVQASDNLVADFGNDTWSTPAWIVLTQMIDHGTEHRTHVGTVLAQVGVQSPPLDMWAYGAAESKIDVKPKG